MNHNLRISCMMVAAFAASLPWPSRSSRSRATSSSAPGSMANVLYGAAYYSEYNPMNVSTKMWR